MDLADAASLSQRPAFWAEVGAVSDPSLLARLGQLVCGLAADDEELRAALRLAASHVLQHCLVWGTTSASPAAAVDSLGASTSAGQVSASPSAQNVAATATGDAAGSHTAAKVGADVGAAAHRPRHFCTPPAGPQPRHARADSGTMSWGSLLSVEGSNRRELAPEHLLQDPNASESELTDSSDEFGSTECTQRVSERTQRLDLLLCLGTWTCQVILVSWCAVFGALHLACVPLLYLAPSSKIWSALDWLCFSTHSYLKAEFHPWVHAVEFSIHAVEIFVAIPMMLSVKRLASCQAMRELVKPVQKDLKAIVCRALTQTLVLALLFFALCYGARLARASTDPVLQPTSWMSTLWALNSFGWTLVQLSIAIVFFVFFFVWQVTWERMLSFSERLATGSEVKDWRALSQEYQTVQECIGKTWGEERFGTAHFCVYLFSALNMLWSVVKGIAMKEHVRIYCEFAWASFMASVLVLFLHKASCIWSKSRSQRYSKRSILSVAAQHYGRVPLHQRWDHHLLVTSILRRPCSIEVALLGNITTPLAVAVGRVVFTAIPSCLAISLHLQVG